jgi:hypothetical protein
MHDNLEDGEVCAFDGDSNESSEHTCHRDEVREETIKLKAVIVQ